MKINDDIRKFLIRNSLITYGSFALAITAMVLLFINTQKDREESRMYVYALNADGNIIPMEISDRRNNIEKELKHHLTMLVDNFYALNKDNWEEKVINKAFNLGDLEKIHTDRANKGYYNRFIQYNTEQKAILNPENIEVNYIENDNYEFKIIVNLIDNYQGNMNNWIVFSRGKAKLTDRHFPNNPHGIWVYEYIEDRIEKIEKDE